MQTFPLSNLGITNRERKRMNSRANIDMHALLLNVDDEGQPHSVVAMTKDGSLTTILAAKFEDEWHLGVLGAPRSQGVMPVPANLRLKDGR